MTWPLRDKPLVGMVHLPPTLPPGRAGPTRRAHVAHVVDRARQDAEHLAAAGLDACLVENYGDTPFARGAAAPHVVALMARVTAEVRAATGLPVGCNVLRNDARGALAAAYAGGADLVRVNVLAGAYVTDQGIIQGDAHALAQDRRLMGADGDAERIALLADVRVKHGAPLMARPLDEEVDDLIGRAGADGLLVTGPATGRPVDLDEARAVLEAAGARVPVWAASGCTIENVAEVLGVLDGVIVGSDLKVGGVTTAPVDPERARAFVRAADRAR